MPSTEASTADIAERFGDVNSTETLEEKKEDLKTLMQLVDQYRASTRRRCSCRRSLMCSPWQTGGASCREGGAADATRTRGRDVGAEQDEGQEPRLLPSAASLGAGRGGGAWPLTAAPAGRRGEPIEQGVGAEGARDGRLPGGGDRASLAILDRAKGVRILPPLQMCRGGSSLGQWR